MILVEMKVSPMPPTKKTKSSQKLYLNEKETMKIDAQYFDASTKEPKVNIMQLKYDNETSPDQYNLGFLFLVFCFIFEGVVYPREWRDGFLLELS